MVMPPIPRPGTVASCGHRCLLCLLPLLSGCISSYSLHSEHDFSAAPDLTAVCGYQWTHVEALFRAENVYAYEWAPAGNFGYTTLDPYVRDLPGSCPNPAATSAPQAQLSAHFIEYSNKAARLAAGLPIAFVMGITLGLAPFPLTNYYAACLQVITPDGARRIGTTKGSLDSFGNIYGTTDGPHRTGGQQETQKREQLMHELTLQAWHKLWLPMGVASEGAVSCPEVLNAIVK